MVMGDIFVPLLVCFLFFCCIAYCLKKRKGGFVSSMLSPGVTVTTTSHVASPVINPPYPIEVRHPTPAPPQLGFTGVPVPDYPTVGVTSNPPTHGVYPHHHTTNYAAPNITPYVPSGSTMFPYPPSNTDGYISRSIAPVPTARPSAPTCDTSHPPSYYEATGHQPTPHEKQCSYNPHY